MEIAGIKQEVWLPILTLVLGGGLTWGRELITGWLVSGREAGVRAELRREEARSRRNAFQRETLLALQDIAGEFLKRATTVSALRRSLEDAGKISEQGAEVLISNSDEGHRLATDINRLLVRVRDPEARQLAIQFASDGGKQFAALWNGEPQPGTGNLAGGYARLNHSIGVILRSMDDEEENLLA